MTYELSHIITLCEVITRLMDPLVECVIHELPSGTISFISGNLSKRKVGDPSLFDPAVIEENLDKIVYPKVNFDGRLVKSISIPIKNQWLVCINADVSIFSHLKTLSERFLTTGRDSEAPLSRNTWRENVHTAISDFLQKKRWSFDHLTNAQKRELGLHLFKRGAFSEKGSAEYIAQILFIGRATIFKYLKEWRNL